jgi:hypothetical protein
MGIQRKCFVCHKELGDFEGHPDSVTIPASPSFNLPSGGVLLYCDKCFEEKIQGYKEINEIINHEKTDKTQLQERVLSKIRQLFEKGAKEIYLTKEKDFYRIRSKY